MYVEVRQRIAGRDNLQWTGKRVHQRLQRLRHLENDMAGPGHDLGHITAELKSVAETLLVVQQYSLAGQVIRAAPLRLREIPSCRAELRGAPSPLMLLPAAFIIADHEPA